MKTSLRIVVGLAAAWSVLPALAMPIGNQSGAWNAGGGLMIVSSSESGSTHRRHRLRYRHPHAEQRYAPPMARMDPQANGGYLVNRYGYGNYVGGPDGGFAGYPPGSPGAYVYQQRENWKCEFAPETC